MEGYLNFVKRYPLISSFVQFAILGFLGEIISYSLRKKLKTIGNPFQIFLKILAWGILGIVIKMGFTGSKGSLKALIENKLFFNIKESSFFYALTLSTLTNTFFGPQMMFFHRLEENIITGRKDFKGIEFSLFSLLWFWIPAHTFTFMLPKDYQIGIAAIWSIVLGIILSIKK
ncbi:MAG: hypothetical protein QME48_05865 [bacterium]|uniref:Uncharacterized protein n=2 Tax=Bacteria candidate phyla TaxID=1783234 RepID=A0A101I190_UNCT6|nr:MAG: Uncharacterized protein XD76_0245 [candidate division TA06 bacterium 32_111]KUK86868.1 MAG: Uncharacterized protein XE03_1231 [candidate division TA06 bacterium 34_109]MDI6700743.1 hypothetical protein [bacterium]HAF07293.1 hypothetical protein [candidate division WOR-3 bacterium]HCP16473.1 hypothetical protein [candidate division WOR-3 bacterium]